MTKISEEKKAELKKIFGPLVRDIGMAVAVNGLQSLAEKLLVTNYEKKGLTGDTEMKPTDKETTVSKSEMAGSETEGKVSKDGVNGTEGKLKANETKGIASTAEATASDNGAQALRNKTGAMDIEAKGMEIQ